MRRATSAQRQASENMSSLKCTPGVASENTHEHGGQGPESASENTTAPAPRRRGRAAVTLPERFATVLDDYAAALRSAPLSDQTRRTYASKVRQFLAWLADADSDRRPAERSTDARDWAVRDYRTPPADRPQAQARDRQQHARRRRRPLHPPRPRTRRRRSRRASQGPRRRRSSTRAAVRFLRAVDASPLTARSRDRADPVLRRHQDRRDRQPRHRRRAPAPRARATCASAARARRSARSRPTPRCAPPSRGWLDERPTGPAPTPRPCFSTSAAAGYAVKGAHDVITAIATTAGLEDEATRPRPARIPSRPGSCAATPTSSSSPSSSATPAWRPPRAYSRPTH